MLLVDYGLKPSQTIFYLTGLIIRELIKKPCTEKELIEMLFVNESREVNFRRFDLALYVLLLTNKLIYVEKGGDLVYVYQKSIN